MYAMDSEIIDTEWGMRVVSDEPLRKTFMVVHVVPPSSVLAA